MLTASRRQSGAIEPAAQSDVDLDSSRELDEHGSMIGGAAWDYMGSLHQQFANVQSTGTDIGHQSDTDVGHHSDLASNFAQFWHHG